MNRLLKYGGIRFNLPPYFAMQLMRVGTKCVYFKKPANTSARPGLPIS